MGIAIIAAKRVQIERNTFDRMSLDILDIEPDWPAPRNGATDILFKDNTIGTYAHSDLYRSHVLSICGTPDALVTNVTVDNNVVTGGRQVNARNSAGGVTARADRPNRTNIRFTNNKSTTPGPGYMVDFQNVTTLTVTGNVQPLTSGKFAYIAQQHERHVPLGQSSRRQRLVPSRNRPSSNEAPRDEHGDRARLFHTCKRCRDEVAEHAKKSQYAEEQDGEQRVGGHQPTPHQG